MYPGWSGGLGGGYGCGILGGGGEGGACGGAGAEGGGCEGGGGINGGEGGGVMGGEGGEGGEGGGGGAKGGRRSGRSGSRPMSQTATPAGTPTRTTNARHARQHMPMGVLVNSSSSSICTSSPSTTPGACCSTSCSKTSTSASSAPLPPVQVAGGSKTRPLRRDRGVVGWLAAVGAVHTLSNVSACCCLAVAPKRVYIFISSPANTARRHRQTPATPHAARRLPHLYFYTHSLMSTGSRVRQTGQSAAPGRTRWLWHSA